MFKPVSSSRSWILIWLLALAVLAGCGASNPHPAGSYERGVFFAEQGKETEAVAALEAYVRHNPTDSLAAEAQYLKAMTYLEMEEYPLAAVEFQILRKDYPISPRVEDAYFHEGEAYLRQVGRIERDVTGAHEARLHYLRFTEEYPTSEYLPQIIEYMQDISDLMVRKRLEQIKVFGQLRRYEAVAITLDTVMEEERGSRLLDEVIMQRAKVAERLDDPDTAARMYEKLIAEYPDSPMIKKARRNLRKLDEADEELEDEDL